MATEVRLRRGTTAQHAAFTGAAAEVTVDTDKKTAVVHDGATVGGFPLARADQVEIHLATAKTTPVDADEFGLWDSAAAAFKKITWASIKATLLNTSLFRLRDTADPTKLLAVSLSGLTPATTRTITMGDADVTLRPQAWELISTQVPSSSASLVWTNLSAYRVLRITGTVRPATDAVAAYIRVSTNNGTSYVLTSTYNYQIGRIGGGASAPIGGSTTGILVAGTTILGNAANELSSFELVLHQFNQGTYLMFNGTAVATSDVGTLVTSVIGGSWGSSTARNAIQVIMDSGNIAEGSVTLEGLRG